VIRVTGSPDEPARVAGPLALALSAACLLGAATPAAAQVTETARGVRSAAATLAQSAITIDGVLDEAAWTSAPTIGQLVQRQPDEGRPPTERTEIRILHDGTALYIGVMCFDSEAGRVIGTQMGRDAALGSDDRIEILLDTFRDQRNAFYFATNPAGALVDGLAFANGQTNNEWDTIWDVRTQRSPEGWSAEFAIPFKSLSFPAGRTVWGFNVARHIYRKLEEVRWTGARLDLRFAQVSEAGELTNMVGLSQGIGLELRPFLGGTLVHTSADGRTKVTGKPGLDMFYNVTPSLKLTATVNTDFGETEVDARQINLGRFSLFFPEKRAFFTEDAGVFSFTSTGPSAPGGIPATGADVHPFFSRQIGLLAGEEVPLDFGVKLTGKVGRTDLGLLNARTRATDAVPDRSFVVGRIRRNILEQSYVGGIFTDGHPALDTSSRTFGADIRLATSRLRGGTRNFVVEGYAVRSLTEGRHGRDWSWGVSANYPNDFFNPQVSVKEVQENFEPALGFVQRRNVRMVRAGGGVNPRPRNLFGIQQMFHDVYFTHFTRLDTGQTESWDVFLTFVDWHLKSGDNLHSIFDLNPTYERLFAPFRIAPGVVLQPGEYRFTRMRVFSFMSASRRPWSGSFNWTTGNYWSGTADQLSYGLTYKLPPKLTVAFNSNQTFARLPEGDFRTTILSWRADYTTSPFLAFSNYVQYDNRSRNLGWQSRVRWTMQPGNDVFFVLNQGWIQEEERRLAFDAQDRKISAKVQASRRF